jgi:hypothetical protein
MQMCEREYKQKFMGKSAPAHLTLCASIRKGLQHRFGGAGQISSCRHPLLFGSNNWGKENDR